MNSTAPPDPVSRRRFRGVRPHSKLAHVARIHGPSYDSVHSMAFQMSTQRPLASYLLDPSGSVMEACEDTVPTPAVAMPMTNGIEVSGRGPRLRCDNTRLLIFSAMSIPQQRTRAKCHGCGAVYWAASKKDIESEAASLARWQRFESCYRCNAPRAGFVRAEPREDRLAATLKPIVLQREPS